MTCNGQREMTIGAGQTGITDPLYIPLNEGEVIQVSFYLADFTLMRSVVYACGPLSEGLYANGDQSGTGKSLFRYRPFTLEGNFAGAAALQEMLLRIYHVLYCSSRSWNIMIVLL